MNNFNAIFLHFFDAIFHVSTGTTSASCISHKLNLLIAVDAESTFSVS
jgi:hypothetical protein